MKRFHPLSFVLGLASGIVFLLIVTGGMRLFTPTPQRGSFGNGGTQSLTRMSQRLGIPEADLQKELDAGKTFQDIAAEHGVQFGGGRGFGRSSVAGSGSIVVPTGSGSSSSLIPPSSVRAQSSAEGN